MTHNDTQTPFFFPYKRFLQHSSRNHQTKSFHNTFFSNTILYHVALLSVRLTEIPKILLY